ASCKPFVAPNTPPFFPTSSPKMNTFSSRCISSDKAAVTACIYDMTGIINLPPTLHKHISARTQVQGMRHFPHSRSHRLQSNQFHCESPAPVFLSSCLSLLSMQQMK